MWLLDAGVVPITESYLILIHSFIKDGNVKTAEAILASMKRAGADAYRGWTMMIKSLLGEGNLTAAKQHLKLGKEHGWWPDSELYEVLMQDLCNRKLSVSTLILPFSNVGLVSESHAKVDVLIVSSKAVDVGNREENWHNHVKACDSLPGFNIKSRKDHIEGGAENLFSHRGSELDNVQCVVESVFAKLDGWETDLYQVECMLGFGSAVLMQKDAVPILASLHVVSVPCAANHAVIWPGSRDESKSFMRTWVQMNNNYVPSMASHILMLRAQLNMNNVSEAADMLIESKVCSCIGEDRKNLVDTILPDLLSKPSPTVAVGA